MLARPLAYGNVVMPIYQGVTGSTVTLICDWRVVGSLPDGRAFCIYVRRGFVFDGASIPRFLWRLCGHPLEAPRIAAALAHDWLYASHVCDRATADAIYLEICRMVGISWFCRTVEHRALRLFGDAAFRAHGPDDQYSANQLGSLEITPKGLRT